MGMEEHARLALRETELRRILEGPCFNCGKRWFSVDTPKEIVDDYLRCESRRQERNRRLRERRRIRRSLDALEARIARMRPWVQTRLYGRTAVTTEIDGQLCPVDYARTYGTPLGKYDGPFLNNREKRDVDDLLAAVVRMYDGLSGVLGRVVGCAKDQSLPVAAGTGYLPPDVERRSRLVLERRKVSRRATVATCPTPTDLRVRWALRREDPQGILRLGMLMLDLECHVDNSLVIKDERTDDVDGTTVVRKRIVRRLGGIRQWLKDNCWELSDKYKTLMRYKSVARRFYQILDIPDPLPLSELFKQELDIGEICSRKVYVQPREYSHQNIPESRFDWELRPWMEDADERSYHLNYRYSTAMSRPLSSDWVGLALASARAVLNRITSPVFPSFDISSGSRKTRSLARVYLPFSNGNWNMSVVFRRLDIMLREHEQWWSRQNIFNSQSHEMARL